MKHLGLLLFILCIPKLVFAKSSLQLESSFESLQFIPNRSQFSINNQETLNLEFKFLYENEEYLKIDLRPRLKIDFFDFSRNRYIPNEANFIYEKNSFELLAGFHRLSWGSSWFMNPTDVINRRDLEDNIYDAEKLGDVMISAKFYRDHLAFLKDASLQIIFMPLFLETPLPENDTRFAIQGTYRGVTFNKADNQEHPDDYFNQFSLATRLAGTIGSVDSDLIFYHGPSRTPSHYGIINSSSGALQAKAYYYTITMIGLNLETSVSDFVFHIESAYTSTAFNGPKSHALIGLNSDVTPKSYFQFVPGIEWHKANLFNKGSLTVLMEYYGEADRSAVIEEFRPFRNDLLLGTKLTLDNKGTTALELGWIKDLGNKESVVRLEASHNLTPDLRLSFQGVWVQRSSNTQELLSFFPNNSYVSVKLSHSLNFFKANSPKS